jgi:hypothetical protein
MVAIRINRSIIKSLGELLLSAIENADDLETAEVLSSAYLFTRALLHRFFPEILEQIDQNSPELLRCFDVLINSSIEEEQTKEEQTKEEQTKEEQTEEKQPDEQ